MVRIEALTYQPTRIKGLDVERHYHKGTVVLEMGGLNFEFRAIINQFFGTDSIIEQQEEERYSDKKRALEIYSASEPDFNRMCFDLDNAPAFQLLSGDGPITGFTELMSCEPLTVEQLTSVEETLMAEQALVDLYGIKGRIRNFQRRRRGFTGGLLKIQYASNFLTTGHFFEAHGIYSPNHHEDRNRVDPVYEVDLTYINKRLTFSRDWLTGCAKNSAAIAFINHWESVSPEERLADFVNQVCTLSGISSRSLASIRL